MRKTINNTDHYLIPGTDKTYYISLDGDVYNIKKQRYISRKGNMISLNRDGYYRKYSCKDLLIDALLAHINEQDSEYCDTIMKLNSILDILNK